MVYRLLPLLYQPYPISLNPIQLLLFNLLPIQFSFNFFLFLLISPNFTLLTSRQPWAHLFTPQINLSLFILSYVSLLFILNIPESFIYLLRFPYQWNSIRGVQPFIPPREFQKINYFLGLYIAPIYFKPHSTFPRFRLRGNPRSHGGEATRTPNHPPFGGSRCFITIMLFYKPSPKHHSNSVRSL